MCMPFCHTWREWSEPFKVRMVPTDEVGNRIGPGFVQLKQSRKCIVCGKYQERKAR